MITYCGVENPSDNMTTNYQDHVERRVKEMRERERMFKIRRRKK